MSQVNQLTIYTVPEATSINKRGALMTILTLLLMLAINIVLYFSPAQAESAPSYHEQVLINLTNSERTKAGLSELTYSPKLAEAARAKAEDMLAKGYFDHVSPDGQMPWDFIRQADYSYLKAGENLAIDYPTVTGPVPAWMASPTHRANILKPGYEEIGIAEVSGTFQGRETRIVVQMFGTPQFSIQSMLKKIDAAF